MAVNANIPPIRIPDSIAELLGDEAADFFNKQSFALYQIWLRSGGADDAISEVQLGELYETGASSGAESLIEEVDAFGTAGFNSGFEALIEEIDLFGFSEPQRTLDFTTGNVTGGIVEIADLEWLKVSGKATINAPTSPELNAQFIITNDNGRPITIDGNGRKVWWRGIEYNDICFSTLGSTYHFQLFENENIWMVR